MTLAGHASWPLMPSVSATTAPFWKGVAQGQLQLAKCKDCGLVFLYPRATCPSCLSQTITWTKASGRGVVWSFSYVEKGLGQPFSQITPYFIVIVELREGPTLMGLWQDHRSPPEIGIEANFFNAGSFEHPLVGFAASNREGEP